MKTGNFLEPKRLEELQKRIWDVATAHGWHEKPISTAQYCGLIMTEMAEAVEADRNGRRADLKTFKYKMKHLDGSDECFKEMYRRYIKGSIEEEFADVVIRVLDMAQGVHGDEMQWTQCYPVCCCYHKDMSFIENAWYFIDRVLGYNTICICNSMYFMFDWAQDLGIDLWQHIEWKMKYNEMRPYKHGGKKY